MGNHCQLPWLSDKSPATASTSFFLLGLTSPRMKRSTSSLSAATGALPTALVLSESSYISSGDWSCFTPRLACENIGAVFERPPTIALGLRLDSEKRPSVRRGFRLSKRTGLDGNGRLPVVVTPCWG